MKKLGASPAFISGSSSGARTSLLFTLRHPEAVRGLMLLRVTGGKFAAERLPENYYKQFIRAAEAGGMAAVCATEEYQQRIQANAKNKATLMAMDPKDYIAKMKRWCELFEAGANYPVMGVTPEQMASIKVPAVIIPGNDLTHASANGVIAHQQLKGSELHRLPVKDEDVALIPYPDWAPHEAEIVRRVPRLHAAAWRADAGRCGELRRQSFRGASHKRVYARLRRAMASEPGIHNHHREYGFRIALTRVRNDALGHIPTPLLFQSRADLIENRRIVDRRRHGPGLAVGDLLDGAAQDFARARLRQPRHHDGELERRHRADLARAPAPRTPARSRRPGG